ncbi:hypothetical protein ABZ806_15450 [Spirillospora sp. NPDC047418]
MFEVDCVGEVCGTDPKPGRHIHMNHARDKLNWSVRVANSPRVGY